MGKYWAGILLLGALLAYAAYSGAASVGLAILTLPLFAWFASRIIVQGGADIWNYARRGSKAEWNGRYYEYAGIRLRAEETDEELVFLEKDLLEVIEQPGSTTPQLFGPKERFLLTGANEMALSQAGCERLLSKCPHRDAKKLMLFLQREAFFPHAKKHGRARTTLSGDLR